MTKNEERYLSNFNELRAYKKRTDPVYLGREDGWPERDNLPHGDPIGDVENYKKEELEFYKNMKKRAINAGGKYSGLSPYYKNKKECTCGTEAVHGKVPNSAHSRSCDLRK
jgi:hypothetical protein